MNDRKLKAVFFDLDGTLGPMDIPRFVSLLGQAFQTYFDRMGMDGKKLASIFMKGAQVMVENDGSRTNKEAYWDYAAKAAGPDILAMKDTFENFFTTDFDLARGGCWQEPQVPPLVDWVTSRVPAVVATNPVFPLAGQKRRLVWAGLDPDRFVRITGYENSRHAKPNPAYYQDILDDMALTADQAVMIGNDCVEDAAAAWVGIDVFLLTTDCTLNQDKVDIDQYAHGDYEDLRTWLTKEKGLEK